MTDGPFFPDPKNDGKKEADEPEELFADEEEYSDDEVEYEEEEYAGFEDDEEEPLPELDTLPTLSEPDPFFDGDDYEDKPTIPWLMIAIIGGVIGLGVAGWFVFASGDAPRGEARLVTANTGPIKTRPDDPGGMQFPHQDKLVYNEVGGEAAPQPETLGPEPEQPMARPEPVIEPAPQPEPAPAPAPAPVAEEPVLPPLPPRTPEPAPEPAPAPAPVVEAPQSTYVEPDPVKDFAPEPDPIPVEEPYSAPTQEPSYPTASGYDWDNSFVLQLGAFSSRERAEKAWDTYSEGNEDVMAGARSNVLAKTTSAGAQVYALRAGPFRTREDATAVREALKGRGVDSFVVAP